MDDCNEDWGNEEEDDKWEEACGDDEEWPVQADDGWGI